MAQLARAEDTLAELVSNPGSAVSRGHIIRDAAGNPVPNAKMAARAQRALDRVPAKLMKATA